MAVKVKRVGAGGGSTAGSSAPVLDWGPLAAIASAVLLALVLAAVLTVPVAIVDHPSGDELSAAANAVAQLAQELAFFAVPFGLALWRGRTPCPSSRRLGLRRFRPSALLWMLGAYVSTSPSRWPTWRSSANPIRRTWAKARPGRGADHPDRPRRSVCEEACFRGMLFGGLRERMPGLAAALVSGLVSAPCTPPPASPGAALMAFGVILRCSTSGPARLFRGSCCTMLNNSIALLGQ